MPNESPDHRKAIFAQLSELKHNPLAVDQNELYELLNK
jgi:hypothetical protein